MGASSWKGGEDLPAKFSNYGQQQVDLFAPGVDILSTVPGNQYERDSGTSMAAPVVTGVAALVMSYYPNLSASDVRKILIASTAQVSDADREPPRRRFEGSRPVRHALDHGRDRERVQRAANGGRREQRKGEAVGEESA